MLFSIKRRSLTKTCAHVALNRLVISWEYCSASFLWVFSWTEINHSHYSTLKPDAHSGVNVCVCVWNHKIRTPNKKRSDIWESGFSHVSGYFSSPLSMFLSASALLCVQPARLNSRVPETTGIWPSATEALQLRAAELYITHLQPLHGVYDLRTVKSCLSGLHLKWHRDDFLPIVHICWT